MHEVVAGEELVLLPERAAWWPRRSTLIVADLHWGKDATFRAAGIPVPGGAVVDDLSRLSRALERTGAERLVVLGDMLHARSGARAVTTQDTLGRWRERHRDLEITLVRGNHDRHAGDPPAAFGISCEDEPMPEPPFVLRHHPAEEDGGYVLAGHVHPAVRLRGPGGSGATLPAFVFGPRVGLLPSFGSFTGSAVVEPSDDDRMFVIAGDEVVRVALARSGRSYE